MPRSSPSSSTLRPAARAVLGFTRGLGAEGEAVFKRFFRFVVTDCTADERALLEAGVVPVGLSAALPARWVAWDGRAVVPQPPLPPEMLEAVALRRCQVHLKVKNLWLTENKDRLQRL